MSWPDCDKSKRIIKLIDQCELSIYGDEMERWSPTTTATKNLIIFRVNKLLDEIISIINKEVDIDDYVQDVSDHWNYSKRDEEL